MNILKLAAMLTLDGTRFKAGLKEAEATAHSAGRSIVRGISGQFAAAFGGGAMVAFVKESISSVGAFKDLAEQAHMSTDEVQKFSAAAEQMGMKFSDIQNAERQFNANRREAVEKNEELRETFAKYGMTLEDLQNPQLRFADFMLKANAAMQGFSPEEMTRGLSDMADMLGDRVGPKLQELIKQLEKLQNMPLVDKKTIDDVDKLSDEYDLFLRKLKATTALTFMNPLDAMAASIAKKPGGMALLKWMGVVGGPGVNNAQNKGVIQTNAPEAVAPSKLFEDGVAKKRRAEFEKAKSELERASLGFGLSKQASLEARIREGMDFIGEAESVGGMTTASAGARKDLMGLIEQLQGLNNFKAPGASSLTSVGQFGGRSFVNSSENEVVKAAKELLKPTQETAENTRKLEAKLKPGGTVRVAR